MTMSYQMRYQVLFTKESCSEITTILEDYSIFIKYFDQAFLPNFIPLNYLVRLFKMKVFCYHEHQQIKYCA